ncbi:hypothetical protein DPMN_143329 [Dreissena polymorpha]|uniref:Uncharacterized protein n=1 Tax=Dreissena polymorpha TaxID=45954 RepID=A0A9D4GCQ2_DREPO|nr:hypothetical protein DPMN_143329 [Dreissena polymorpha]
MGQEVVQSNGSLLHTFGSQFEKFDETSHVSVQKHQMLVLQAVPKLEILNMRNPTSHVTEQIWPPKTKTSTSQSLTKYSKSSNSGQSQTKTASSKSMTKNRQGSISGQSQTKIAPISPRAKANKSIIQVNRQSFDRSDRSVVPPDNSTRKSSTNKTEDKFPMPEARKQLLSI